MTHTTPGTKITYQLRTQRWRRFFRVLRCRSSFDGRRCGRYLGHEGWHVIIDPELGFVE